MFAIAHVVPSFGFGGAERVAAHLARRAARRGHRVRIVAPRGGRAHEGLERESGIAVEGIVARRPDEPNSADARRFAADALIRLRSCDLVHAHLPWPDRVGTALVARGTRPCVMTFHLLPDEPAVWGADLAFGTRVAIPRLLGIASRVGPLALVALTKADRARLARVAPGSRIEQIANAPPPADAADPGLLPEGRGTTLLAVGRLVAQKGVDRLLDTLATEPARSAAWTLYVCGDGEARAALEARAHARGIAERVYFLGARPAAQLLRRVELFVTASRSEGMPLALLEAMAAGVAVAASPIPAHAELLAGVEGALLPEDEAAWPGALAALVGDAALRRRLADRARDASRPFDPEIQDDAYERLYRELVPARH